jgi:PAS domain S-box-containing protein
VVISRQCDGEILFCNDKLAKIVGVPTPELIGRRTLDFYYDSADRDAVLSELNEQGRVRDRETRLRASNGETVWVLLTIEPLHVFGETLLLCTVVDVTRRKEMEDLLQQSEARCHDANEHLRDAQRQLLATEKMASLGLLMAGIAHEIRTPLGAVSSTQHTIAQALDRLTRQLAEAHPEALCDSTIGRLLKVLGDSVRVVGDGSLRVTDIVQRLRKFSCPEEVKLCPVDVNAIVEDTLALVQHELKHNVAIQKCLGEGVTIMGYPSRLNQVLVNLLVNAAHAVRARGRGQITIATQSLGDQIVIKVSDDGVGIPPGDLKQIFTCGFTTKTAEGGSGLGLAISKEIVSAHHGSLEVESQIGRGTTFTVKLPRTLSERRVGPWGCRFG